jgi:hypothetical protein
MPDMPPPVPNTAAMPAVVDAAALPFDDFDYALGCECADPALQIERWDQEARDAADAN